MHELLSKIKVTVNSHLYLKDPFSSELGYNMIREAVRLIDELGFDDFNFRKLGQEIHSPEASVYRYFENKHKLLLYLSSWYWSWAEYRLVIAVNNISSAEKRLEIAIGLMTDVEKEGLVSGIDLKKLSSIVATESVKSFLHREVDKVNHEGAFSSYKQFVARVAAIISEINPAYKFPHMLVSTVIEGAHLQRFFAGHLPGLTNKQKDDQYLSRFFSELVFKAIQNK